MRKPKPKYPETRLPLSPALRDALYDEAEKLGRGLTVHIQMKLEASTPGYKAARGAGK